MPEITKPELKEGELHAGAIINPDGTGNHIILLPGDYDNNNWQSSMDYAKALGGDLPSRVEAGLLYNKSKAEFQETWYWTNETHVDDTEWAWCQGFAYGIQSNFNKLSKLRARAVRRVSVI